MLTVLMPSRDRERQAAEAYEAFLNTKSRPDTEMRIILDEDEPGYEGLPALRVKHDGGMGNALNAGLQFAGPGVVGFVGDDHRFRSEGWDEAIIAANDLLGGGIVYGNDLLRGEDLPSQVFIDRRITDALGWMALPGATHLFFDDTWRTLGATMDRLKYLPNVVIEHMHFTAGKSEFDHNYARVNDHSLYAHDADIYWAWVANRMALDVETALAAVR